MKRMKVKITLYGPFKAKCVVPTGIDVICTMQATL